MNNTAVIILAGGDGKRMNSDVPKVMHLLHGKPLIDHVVSQVEQNDIKPVVVVNSKHTLVQDYLQDRAEYVVQHEQLGTGHAVKVTSALLKDRQLEQIVVLYGDMPFVSAQTIEQLISKQRGNSATIVLATCMVEHFEGKFSAFKFFSRIVRDEFGKIIKDVQIQDATNEELQIREINASFYCFDATWLWEYLKKLQTNNNQKEYYLTDLIAMAVEEGKNVESISVDSQEAYGITTAEDLEMAHDI
ncbi:MAG: NTP transferase domain-containing protein [Candidatus Magasanikbacteria bacterium]|nr:NTP transferase domain-containing protein [Candidatus Magasanikbacteria bacterium]